MGNTATKQILPEVSCDDGENNLVLNSYNARFESRFNQNQTVLREQKKHVRDVLL